MPPPPAQASCQRPTAHSHSPPELAGGVRLSGRSHTEKQAPPPPAGHPIVRSSDHPSSRLPELPTTRAPDYPSSRLPDRPITRAPDYPIVRLPDPSRRQGHRPRIERNFIISMCIPVQRDALLFERSAVDLHAQEFAGGELAGQRPGPGLVGAGGGAHG